MISQVDIFYPSQCSVAEPDEIDRIRIRPSRGDPAPDTTIDWIRMNYIFFLFLRGILNTGVYAKSGSEYKPMNKLNHFRIPSLKKTDHYPTVRIRPFEKTWTRSVQKILWWIRIRLAGLFVMLTGRYGGTEL